jgi:hypothetical protein
VVTGDVVAATVQAATLAYPNEASGTPTMLYVVKMLMLLLVL